MHRHGWSEYQYWETLDAELFPGVRVCAVGRWVAGGDWGGGVAYLSVAGPTRFWCDAIFVQERIGGFSLAEKTVDKGL